MKRKKAVTTIALIGVVFITIVAIFVTVEQSTGHSLGLMPKTEQRKPAKPKYRPLTTNEMHNNNKLRYSGIIYYAVKHLDIQRWQEVSNFERGWQIEIYHQKETKYLVWPNKRIKKDEKLLEPNWFTIDQQNRINYDSFGVHSFRKDMTAAVSEKKIVAQVNKDHAAQKVRKMQRNMTILKH